MLQAWREIADGTRDEYRRFVDACAATERTQAAVLMDILATNASSDLGQRLDFASIRTIDCFRNRVPVSTYEDLASAIDAQSRGGSPLCAEPVRFYEQTGGSTGGPKLVPFTACALRALQRAVEPWLANLVANRPAIAGGPGYWSLSPAARARRETTDGTAIGSESDLVFMRASLRRAFAATLGMPLELAAVTRVDQWRSYTLLSLVMQQNLRLISIWSPSFLRSLINSLTAEVDNLQRLLGEPKPWTGLPAFMRQVLHGKRDRQAASARLAKAFARGHLDTQALWPNLDTVSCWMHGAAAGPARELRRLFPHAFMQPKGLLATEGVVSIPLCSAAMPLLAVRSGFFEFLDEDDRYLLAHELEAGGAYRVILTTFSGFYRYDLGDTVRMHGTCHGAPMLEFVGRQGVISDLCGEKLSEAFVSRCLDQVTGFAMVAPLKTGYCLFVDSRLYAGREIAALTTRIEARLRTNPQYAYARRIGQLEPLTALRIERPADKYLMNRARLGQTMGAIKPTALCLDAGVHAWFASST